MATEKDVEKHISGDMATFPRSQAQALSGWAGRQLPNQIISVCKAGKIKTSHLVMFGWLFQEAKAILLNQNILYWKA